MKPSWHAVDLINYRKQILRKKVKSIRDALPNNKRTKLSNKIASRIIRSRFFDSANCVAAYSPIGSEVDTSFLIAKILNKGKSLLLPLVENNMKVLSFYEVVDYFADTVEGKWGIRQPVRERCNLVSLSTADVIIVPGVVFSPHGERIGYGGGFYDSTLPTARKGACKIGLSFACQIFKDIPIGTRDKLVSAVMCDNATYGDTH
ncbi:MAG: 5-formyltetrahydrofolate cyclo-ligase [Proteobacteria bacterium]|nr:5-formyltetrahydrofolate cyclo-ligase [Pseudomonadota bacterium]